MPVVKVLKTIVDAAPNIFSEINRYATRGSMRIVPDNGDYTILEAFGVDRGILTLYDEVKEGCSIEDIMGVIETSTAVLDEVWEDDVLVRDFFTHKVKGDWALLYMGTGVGANYIGANNALLRKLVDRFKTTDFLNFYCTVETRTRKVQGYDIVKAEILDMLKDDLIAWMIERGLDKLMKDFEDALKADLQTFVVEYYFL